MFFLFEEGFFFYEFFVLEDCKVEVGLEWGNFVYVCVEELFFFGFVFV